MPTPRPAWRPSAAAKSRSFRGRRRVSTSSGSPATSCCIIDTEPEQLSSAARHSVASRSKLHLSRMAVRSPNRRRFIGGVAGARYLKGKFLMKLDFRQRLLATTLLVGVAALANPAYAQESQSPVPDENQPTNPGGAPPTGDVASQPTPTVSAEGEAVQEAQDIIVTGTRIPQPNLESAAPGHGGHQSGHQAVGLTRIDDVLNQLPSAAATQGAGPSQPRDRHRGNRPSLSRRQAHPDPDQRPPHGAG